MSAVKVGNAGLPDAPVVSKDYIPGQGETVSHEWPLGTRAEVEAKYEEMKAEADVGGNTQSLSFRNANGRCSLVAKFGRSSTGNEQGDDITKVEELYAVDVIGDIAESTYFTGLSDDQVAWIRYCVENRLTDAQISEEANALGNPSTLQYTSWSALMKSFRFHLLHGVESYYQTGFILRESNYCARTASVKASFANINTVQAAPSLSANMNTLIESLPTGEWLYRPPQAESLGRGRWRITREWHWAKKWSVMYGGTWDKPS